MTPEQFAYWLQGYTELTAGQQPTPEQWKSITEHLKTVFVKVTPEVGVQPLKIDWPHSTSTKDILDAIGRGPRDLLPNEIRITC